jgi:hypothetical protein
MTGSSVVNVTQIATIDRQRLVGRAGTLRRADLARVDDGLRLARTCDGLLICGLTGQRSVAGRSPSR